MSDLDIKVGDVFEGKINMIKGGSAYLSTPNSLYKIYINKKNTNKSMHLDEVLVRVIKTEDNKLEGVVDEIIKRDKEEFVGTLRISKRFAFLSPISNNIKDIYIPLKLLNGAKNGDKAIAKIIKWSDSSKNPKGSIIKVLGKSGDNDVEIHSILHEYGLPYEFDEKVELEANSIPSNISPDEIKKRKDLRNVLTFTIDPVDAKDFDDALSIEWVNGKMRVGIHIADVSYYVKPNTELDKEAYKRGTSVYLVDRVIPMLPERLSNGLCSLRPNEDKLCFSIILTLDNNGHIIDKWIGRTIINSNYRFTYEEAQHIIENKGMIFDDMEEVSHSIYALDKMAKKLRKKRLKNGSISFDKKEIKFVLNEKKEPIGVTFKVQKDSNKLIEEFMLLANKEIATFLKERGICVNRAHKEPDMDKLLALKEFITPFGYQIKLSNINEIKNSINKLLTDIKDKPEENVISTLVIRTMEKAFYTTENIGHYGLGFDNYSHFTSPIRRYPDVIIHRLLSKHLNLEDNIKLNDVQNMTEHLSEMENRAQKASRSSIKYMQCLYMSDKIGKIYSGVVSYITEYSLFIEMKEVGSECIVKLSGIDGDDYIPELNKHRIKGRNSGRVIRLGDEVNVSIKKVDIESKNIEGFLVSL